MIKSSVVKDLIERTSLSLAEILTPTDQGLKRVGTGFAVSSDGKLATCTHVINGLRDYYAQFWGEEGVKPHKAELAIQDADRDLAVLSIEHATRPLPLGNFDNVNLGDDVVWAGFPLEVWVPSFHKGMISFKGELPLPHTTGPTEGIQLDGPINRGNSGGPVIDARNGQAIAVVSSSMGRLDEELTSLLRRREYATITIGGVDPVRELKRIVADMDRYLQLGVGYGISVRYLSTLLSRL